MLSGQQPTMFGDGEQSRDFTYIDNAVEANLLACKAPAAQAAGKVFNVATGRRVTLNETFKLLQNLTSYSGLRFMARNAAATSSILWLTFLRQKSILATNPK